MTTPALPTPATSRRIIEESEDYWQATEARIAAENAADRKVARDMNEGLPRDPFLEG